MAKMASLQSGKPVSAEKLARQRRIAEEQERAKEFSSSSSSTSSSVAAGGGKQRNYKNMTRERRVEANARERQRVHTITAAFDTLQVRYLFF